MNDLTIEATASQEQVFKPMIIGEQDWAAQLNVENHYEAICNVLNHLFATTKEIVFLGKDLSIDDFFGFIESKEPERWCYRKYVAAADLSFQKMDTERIIDLKLFQIENFDQVMQLYKKFKDLKSKQVDFDYPLRKLYVAEQSEFSVNNSEDPENSFYIAVERRFSQMTETPEQNHVLQILTEIAENYNKLVELGILRPKNGILELDVINTFFDLNKLEREYSPFKVNSYIFKRHNRLAPFRNAATQQNEKKTMQSDQLKGGFVIQG